VNDRKPPKSPSEPPRVATPLRGVVIPSSALFRGSKVVWIEHDGERYQLRITSQGKLILTK
jgi:hemin uptake protein HemP